LISFTQSKILTSIFFKLGCTTLYSANKFASNFEGSNKQNRLILYLAIYLSQDIIFKCCSHFLLCHLLKCM